MTERRVDRSEDDDKLVEAARGGDSEALEELLRRHATRIHSVCRRIAANPDDAADAFQEAMIAIATKLDRFDGRSAFGTWVYRVTTNVCFDELRRRRRAPEPAELPDQPSSAQDPIDRVDVDSALMQLPLDFRAAVVLRDLCGLDYAEISEVLGIPVGTVRSRISRGRAALVPILTGNSDPDPDRPTESR